MADETINTSWQDISTAPLGVVIDIWIDSDDEAGWVVTGMIVTTDEPMGIDTGEESIYWPHENGGWPIKWGVTLPTEAS